MNVIASDTDVDPRLWDQVYAEYLAMPGLQLTLRQAARLWNTNLDVSQQVLDTLVDRAFLRRTGPYYVRADSDCYSA